MYAKVIDLDFHFSAILWEVPSTQKILASKILRYVPYLERCNAMPECTQGHRPTCVSWYHQFHMMVDNENILYQSLLQNRREHFKWVYEIKQCLLWVALGYIYRALFIHSFILSVFIHLINIHWVPIKLSSAVFVLEDTMFSRNKHIAAVFQFSSCSRHIIIIQISV